MTYARMAAKQEDVRVSTEYTSSPRMAGSPCGCAPCLKLSNVPTVWGNIFYVEPNANQFSITSRMAMMHERQVRVKRVVLPLASTGTARLSDS